MRGIAASARPRKGWRSLGEDSEQGSAHDTWTSRSLRRIQAVHERLILERRPYAVLATAFEDFRRNDLRYHTYYFTVNAFMGVLALFMAVTSLTALLGDGEFKRQLIDGFSSLMPILRGDNGDFNSIFETFRGAAGIISLLFLVWAATRIFSALENGFGRIWGREKRRYSRMLLVGLLMITVVGALFVLTSAVQVGFDRFWSSLVGSHSVDYYLGVSVAKPLIGLLVDFLLFLFVYRVVTGARPSWRNCALGGILSAALFLGTQYVLNLYFDYIYKVPLIYGSLATGIMVILWMQATGLITFFGAELVYVLENGYLIEERAARAALELNPTGLVEYRADGE